MARMAPGGCVCRQGRVRQPVINPDTLPGSFTIDPEEPAPHTPPVSCGSLCREQGEGFGIGFPSVVSRIFRTFRSCQSVFVLAQAALARPLRAGRLRRSRGCKGRDKAIPFYMLFSWFMFMYLWVPHF